MTNCEKKGKFRGLSPEDIESRVVVTVTEAFGKLSDHDAWIRVLLYMADRAKAGMQIEKKALEERLGQCHIEIAKLIGPPKSKEDEATKEARTSLVPRLIKGSRFQGRSISRATRGTDGEEISK